ncbi:MAG TPA: BON domain-containing protein [Pyrinomonadaceae bacterium]|jgi:hypothetical protein
MNRYRLEKLLVIAAALSFVGCGGAVERAGDGKAAAAPPAANAASPAPTTDGRASAAATPADTASTLPASAGDAAAGKGATPASGSRGSGGAPPSKAPPPPRIGSGGNDLFLFTQARAAINADPELKTANLIVEVKEGVVTLSGAVASAALKEKAEELARGAGPKAVRNQLRVSAGK